MKEIGSLQIYILLSSSGIGVGVSPFTATALIKEETKKKERKEKNSKSTNLSAIKRLNGSNDWHVSVRFRGFERQKSCTSHKWMVSIFMGLWVGG